MEYVADLITISIATVSFLYLAFAMVVPWRKPDSLTLVYGGLFLTWGVILGLGFVQRIGLLPLRLPQWERWIVRITLDVLGVAGVILVRVYRHRKGN